MDRSFEEVLRAGVAALALNEGDRYVVGLTRGLPQYKPGVPFSAEAAREAGLAHVFRIGDAAAPLASVVIPTLDAGPDFADTLAAVRSQPFTTPEPTQVLARPFTSTSPVCPMRTRSR